MIKADITNVGVALFNRNYLEVILTILGVDRDELNRAFIYKGDLFESIL